jgi:large subunit ribosomal protein L9
MALHLLLVKDVADLGRSGDIVKVKNGYARNYLLPQECGVIADKNALKMQERLKQERLKMAEKDKSEAEALAKNFENLTITTVVKVDQEGHMYGSVATADIIKLLQDEAKLHVEKRMIQLKHPVKTVGEHTIQLKLNEGVPATFILKVVAEGAKEKTEEVKASNA